MKLVDASSEVVDRSWSGMGRKGGAVTAKRSVKAASQGEEQVAVSVDGSHPRQTSALRLYLNDIGNYPRLSAEEELEVARKMRVGCAESRERMINGNLRLVVKIARDFEGYGMPVSDLINEGNIGLMKAVEHFDPERGVKFSTYSAYWIKQSVKRCLSNQSRTVRIPIHMVEKISRLNQLVLAYKEEFDREPTDKEMAGQMEMEVADIRAIKRAQAKSVSLNTPFEEGDSETLGDRIPDENAVDPCVQLELQTSISRMCELLDRLQHRESTILRERYGLDGSDPKTLEDIGKEFGVTRERIRQLQNEALVKLRGLMEDWGVEPATARG